MPITEKQRQRRNKHIGGSDVPTIMGVNPFASEWDLWMEKTGRAEPKKDNAAMKAGRYFEKAVIEWYQDEYGPVVRNQYRSYPEAYLGSHIDALVQGKSLPVEVKTAGLFGPLNKDWGEDGSGEVPDHVILQAHAHMICLAPMTPEMCHVAAFLGGRGFMLFEVPFNKDIAEAIKSRCVHFWESYMVKDCPPESNAHSLDVLSRIRREPNKIIRISRETIEQYQLAKSKLKDAQRAADDVKAMLLYELGDAEAGECEGFKVTYMEHKRGAYQVPESKYRKLSVKEVA